MSTRLPSTIASIPRQKPSEYTIKPPNTAQVKIIGKPSHTAETEIRPRRACSGTGISSYSGTECRWLVESGVDAVVVRVVVVEVVGGDMAAPRRAQRIRFPIGSVVGILAW